MHVSAYTTQRPPMREVNTGFRLAGLGQDVLKTDKCKKWHDHSYEPLLI